MKVKNISAIAVSRTFRVLSGQLVSLANLTVKRSDELTSYQTHFTRDSTQSQVFRHLSLGDKIVIRPIRVLCRPY